MKHLVMFLLREIIRPVVEEVVAEQMRRPDDRGPVQKAIKRGLSLVSSRKT